jgi:hypothetical protein
MALNLTLRKSFLYIFATVGLILVIIAGVSLIDLGLKTYVFTKADYPCYFEKPYPAPAERTDSESQISPEEMERQNRDAERRCVENRVAEKQRQASNAIAMLIVGLPLYAYHWMTIRRENQV